MDTYFDGLVAADGNVFDFGSVDIFDSINGVFNDAGFFLCVTAKDQIFHIRALLEHVGGIFFTVECKRNDFIVVRVVNVNGDKEILICIAVEQIGTGFDIYICIGGFVFVISISVVSLTVVSVIAFEIFIIKQLDSRADRGRSEELGTECACGAGTEQGDACCRCRGSDTFGGNGIRNGHASVYGDLFF